MQKQGWFKLSIWMGILTYLAPLSTALAVAPEKKLPRHILAACATATLSANRAFQDLMPPSAKSAPIIPPSIRSGTSTIDPASLLRELNLADEGNRLSATKKFRALLSERLAKVDRELDRAKRTKNAQIDYSAMDLEGTLLWVKEYLPIVFATIQLEHLPVAIHGVTPEGPASQQELVQALEGVAKLLDYLDVDFPSRELRQRRALANELREANRIFAEGISSLHARANGFVMPGTQLRVSIVPDYALTVGLQDMNDMFNALQLERAAELVDEMEREIPRNAKANQNNVFPGLEYLFSLKKSIERGIHLREQIRQAHSKLRRPSPHIEKLTNLTHQRFIKYVESTLYYELASMLKALPGFGRKLGLFTSAFLRSEQKKFRELENGVKRAYTIALLRCLEANDIPMAKGILERASLDLREVTIPDKDGVEQTIFDFTKSEAMFQFLLNKAFGHGVDPNGISPELIKDVLEHAPADHIEQTLARLYEELSFVVNRSKEEIDKNNGELNFTERSLPELTLYASVLFSQLQPRDFVIAPRGAAHRAISSHHLKVISILQKMDDLLVALEAEKMAPFLKGHYSFRKLTENLNAEFSKGIESLAQRSKKEVSPIDPWTVELKGDFPILAKLDAAHEKLRLLDLPLSLQIVNAIHASLEENGSVENERVYRELTEVLQITVAAIDMQHALVRQRQAIKGKTNRMFALRSFALQRLVAYVDRTTNRQLVPMLATLPGYLDHHAVGLVEMREMVEPLEQLRARALTVHKLAILEAIEADDQKTVGTLAEKHLIDFEYAQMEVAGETQYIRNLGKTVPMKQFLANLAYANRTPTPHR